MFPHLPVRVRLSFVFRRNTVTQKVHTVIYYFIVLVDVRCCLKPSIILCAAQRMRQRSVVKRKDTASGEPLYHPSIFRYKCHGRLQLSTKDSGSAGVCQGLKTQLEHVDHWRLVTRDEGV